MPPSRAYPVLILCGRDQHRRELLEVLDPDGRYPSKAVLPLAGKRVLDWQLDALRRSPYVSQIFLIGLSPAQFPSPWELHYIPASTTSSILEKISQGSRALQQAYPELEHLIISTGDAPGMQTESVNQFFEAFLEHKQLDLLLAGVPEAVTSPVFPDHGRVVARFRDAEIYPGEMLVLRHAVIPRLSQEIDQLAARRRQFNRRADTSKLIPVMRYLARRPRLWLLILTYLTGQLSLQQAERILSRTYGLTLRTVIISDPGFGMDLDLPEDYQKLSDYVQKTHHSGA